VSRREKLMHPATFISLLALFVALGGVGYAATRIGTKQLKNRAVTNKKLANNSVTSRKIRSGAVGNLDLADGSVFGAKLQDGAVGTGKLGDGAVTSGKLGAAAVTSGKLAASSVTAGAIAPNSVGASQIADGQVVEGNGRLQQAQVTVGDGTGTSVLNFPGIGALDSDCGAGQSTTHFTNNSGGTIQATRWGVNGTGAVVESVSMNNGDTIDQQSNPGGSSGFTWLISFTDTAGLHLLKMEVVTRSDALNCVVTAQAIRPG